MKFSKITRHLNMKDVNRKQLQKEEALTETPTNSTSNIYPQTSEVPNQKVIDFVAAVQGGYPLGLSASDGNHMGNADTSGTISGFTDVALAPPHPVTGVRRSAVHITSGLGNSTPLRPGQTTTIGFGDNPPTRTMGSALWFYDPNYNSGEGQWSNLEYGVEQGAWGFWDTVKSGQFTGLYIFNTDLSQHPSGDISSKISGINFGANGQIGPPKNILITQRGIGDINYHGPITPGRLFGLSDQGYNYLDGKSKRRLRKGTRYRTAGGGAYPTTGRTTTFTTGSRLQSAKDETGAPETPTSSTSASPKTPSQSSQIPEKVNEIISHDISATQKLEALNNLISTAAQDGAENLSTAFDAAVEIGQEATTEASNNIKQGFETLKGFLGGGADWAGDFINGFGDATVVLNQMSQAVSNAYKEGNVEDGKIKEGAPGSTSNPIQTQVSNSTAEDILQGVDLNDIITQGEFTNVAIQQLLTNLARDPISGNLGAKAIHNNLDPSNANNIRINENGDLIIPDTYAFRPLGHENNPMTKAYANIVGLLGGNKEEATKDFATILDQSIGAFLNIGQGILNTVLGSDDSFLTTPLASARTGGFVPGRNDPAVHFQTVITKAQLLEILKRGNNKIPFSEKAIEALEKLTSEQKNEILKSMGMEDPTSEENFEYNKPSWFTFSHRTDDGRIYGYNFSGAFGELKLASSRGERGSMESGYGTRGYDPKTNSGGTAWTMDYDGTSMWDQPDTSKPKSDPKPDPKPKKPFKPTPQGGRGGGQGNPTNKRGSGFPESKDTYYQSKGELLSEATKLGHFEPDILDVDIKDIRKGIMPEYPEKPPAEMIDGYHQDSKLKPKELNKEPFLKIDEKDLIRNHRLKPNEAQEMMQTIDRINDHIKKHPEDLIHAQMRYPIDDPRLAELNWKMDQMLEAGEEYLEKNFKENKKLFNRVVDRTKKNIKLTDPRYVQQRYDELRGTNQKKKNDKELKNMKLKLKLKKYLPQYESKGVFKHVDSDDFKRNIK